MMSRCVTESESGLPLGRLGVIYGRGLSPPPPAGVLSAGRSCAGPYRMRERVSGCGDRTPQAGFGQLALDDLPENTDAFGNLLVPRERVGQAQRVLPAVVDEAPATGKILDAPLASLRGHGGRVDALGKRDPDEEP